ncbi:MAG: SIR2 family protein [Saprospiraceae bacterium]
MVNENKGDFPDLPRIVSDIKAGKCALILGPEIFQVEGIPLSVFVRNRVLEHFPDQIAAYYERDGFFLLRNPDDKPEIQDEVTYLFQEIDPDETILRKIIEIPFSVVLSVNPDTFLRDMSFRYGLPHRFAWFDASKESDVDLPEADPDLLKQRVPLYYNLLGCVEKQSTLILDYDDLFRLFQGLIAAPKLPGRLMVRLAETTSYLFLGFQFDRWHTQLLLRLLDVKRAARRFALHSVEPKEEETEAFLVNQFRIKFLGDDTHLLDQIHREFEKEDNLRQTTPADTPAKEAIVRFLQKGKTENAIAKLIEAAKGTPVEQASVGLSARFFNWQTEKNGGRMDSRDVFREMNLINDAILSFAKEL